MSRSERLSFRQVAILRAVRDWIAEYGEGPSIRQIGHRVGLSSSSSVAYQLGRLEALGYISRTRVALAFLPPWPLSERGHIMVPGRRMSAYTRAVNPDTPGSRRTGAMPDVAHHSSSSVITARAVASSAAVMSRTTRPDSRMCWASMSMPLLTRPGLARFAGPVHPIRSSELRPLRRRCG